MRRPPPGSAHPYSSDLARTSVARGGGRVDPYPRVAVPAPHPSLGHAERHQCTDHHVFDLTNVLWPAMRPVADAADRISHELAGSVEGDITATVDLDQFGPDVSRVHQDVCRIAVRAQRVDSSVLEQQEIVVIGPLRQRLLQIPGLGVRDASQPACPHGSVTADRPRAKASR